MQANIKFNCRNLILPIHYNQVIQGFLYSNLSDKDFRYFLHEQGFKNGKRSFKLFTFSRLHGKFTYDNKNKTITFHDEISLTISSLVDDFIRDLLHTLLFTEKLEINHQRVILSSVETENKKADSERILVKAVSPIVTYSTVTLDGNRRTIYHSPMDPIFNEHIKNNLMKKTQIIDKTISNQNFEIKLAKNHKLKENYSYFKNIFIKGWSGYFELKGNPRLLNIGLGCGLGSKNSQGFGCIKYIRDL
jgi:CRISPR-associated endoribonuclease Cas6